ncbi:NnrU family protein [Marinobacter caseinilyticus]|uniref:NnrU family protein n=1 Tax=Marinobacter caseinilyticus TaxID=2692195 RepID=UPI00140AC277|nr:NnrU family protein [Marinobacter caseinilyticus]
MALLVAGLLLFLGVHSISIINEPLRNRLAAAMGDVAFKGVYSLIALAGLVLIVSGYGSARLDPTLIYQPPGWLRHLALLLLLPVFPLFFATYFPGKISATLKHPTLVAVKLWALAHLLANGMLHDLVLFGAFLAWAVADRISIKRRVPRKIHAFPARATNDVIAIVGGLAVYVLTVLWLHQWLIGVSPV